MLRNRAMNAKLCTTDKTQHEFTKDWVYIVFGAKKGWRKNGWISVTKSPQITSPKKRGSISYYDKITWRLATAVDFLLRCNIYWVVITAKERKKSQLISQEKIKNLLLSWAECSGTFMWKSDFSWHRLSNRAFFECLFHRLIVRFRHNIAIVFHVTGRW